MNTQLKMGYKTSKQMKKLYGKILAFDIASGRKLIQFMRKKYPIEENK